MPVSQDTGIFFTPYCLHTHQTTSRNEVLYLPGKSICCI